MKTVSLFFATFTLFTAAASAKEFTISAIEADMTVNCQTKSWRFDSSNNDNMISVFSDLPQAPPIFSKGISYAPDASGNLVVTKKKGLFGSDKSLAIGQIDFAGDCSANSVEVSTQTQINLSSNIQAKLDVEIAGGCSGISNSPSPGYRYSRPTKVTLTFSDSNGGATLVLDGSSTWEFGSDENACNKTTQL